MRMIRTPEWKLVRHFEPGEQDELYHLAEDPGETVDLANSPEPAIHAERAELARRLAGWMTQIGDRLGPGAGALPEADIDPEGVRHSG